MFVSLIQNLQNLQVPVPLFHQNKKVLPINCYHIGNLEGTRGALGEIITCFPFEVFDPTH